jgi:hypothetical protein
MARGATSSVITIGTWPVRLAVGSIPVVVARPADRSASAWPRSSVPVLHGAVGTACHVTMWVSELFVSEVWHAAIAVVRGRAVGSGPDSWRESGLVACLIARPRSARSPLQAATGSSRSAVD